MFRSKTKTGVQLDELGGNVFLDVSGLSELRGQADLDDGTFGACVLAFEFSCAIDGGKWHEPTTATRLAAQGVSTAAIDCSGFARARLRVVVVSATAGTKGTLTLSARGN